MNRSIILIAILSFQLLILIFVVWPTLDGIASTLRPAAADTDVFDVNFIANVTDEVDNPEAELHAAVSASSVTAQD